MSTTNTSPTLGMANGTLTMDWGDGKDEFRSIIQQTDGKLVAVGTSNNDIALARFNLDGTLDTSFSSDGKLTLAFVNTSSSGIKTSRADAGYDVYQQANGKLVVAGGSEGLLALARYNADGTLDTSFSDDGTLVDTSYYIGQSIIQQIDGRLAVINTNGTIVRYNVDGTKYNYFGTYSYGKDIIQQPDGKLVAAGEYYISRHLADGKYDPSFSGDGLVVISFGYDGFTTKSLIRQTDGKLVVAGYSGSDFALARVNPDGTLDASFGNEGKVTTDIAASSLDYAFSVIQQTDGKLVVAGYSGSDFALVRYNVDGSLDTSFDGDGKVTTNVVSFTDEFGYSLIQQTDGKLVVAGASDGNFALIRYNPDGSLDTTFAPPAGEAYTEGGSPVALAPSVLGRDAELSVSGNYGGASVTLSRQGGANAQDVFTGIGALSTLSEGSDFQVGSATIGRVNTNSGGVLKLSFNTNTTQALLDQTLQQIAYSNTANIPPASVKISWLFNDGNSGFQGEGGALSTSANSTVKITATNDAPVSADLLQNRTAPANAIFSYLLPTGAFSDPDLDTLTYSVSMANGSVAPAWLLIDNQTGRLLGTPDPQDIGTLMLQVTATDPAGATASSKFALTVSKAVNNVPEGSVSIKGIVTKGQMLTASNNLTDTDGLGTIRYQWKANETIITGANSNTLVLDSSQVGKTISVTANYIDGRGNAESKTSSPTVAVLDFNDALTSRISISGIAHDTLTSDWFVGSNNIDAVQYTGRSNQYTWLRDENSGQWIVTGSGTDRLDAIERLQFSDKKIAFDLAPTQHAGQAVLFWGVLTGGTYSTSSFGTVLNQLDTGRSLLEVFQMVVNNGTVGLFAGSNSQTDLVRMAFRNVVGSEADTATIDSLVSFMDGRTANFTSAEFLTTAAMLDINKSHVGLVGLQSEGIEYI